MNGSRDLEGVHGPKKVLDLLGVSQAAESTRFQPNNGVGAATADEAANGVQGVSPLPLGMEREDSKQFDRKRFRHTRANDRGGIR